MGGAFLGQFKPLNGWYRTILMFKGKRMFKKSRIARAAATLLAAAAISASSLPAASANDIPFTLVSSDAGYCGYVSVGYDDLTNDFISYRLQNNCFIRLVPESFFRGPSLVVTENPIQYRDGLDRYMYESHTASLARAYEDSGYRWQLVTQGEGPYLWGTVLASGFFYS